MFSTYCEGGDHPNFDATVPISDSVQLKIDYWKKQAAAGKETKKVQPISVLYIGIDSTSRSHFYRSFKKTSKLLRQLGFWDFEAHHATAAYTIRNMFAMLAGYSMADMTRAMRGWRKRYYDDVDWIWKLFEAMNYVTFNLQDRQTFNIDAGSEGFKRQPTDYYLRPMMAHMESYWKKLGTTSQSKLFDDCLSPQMSSGKFILNYNRKFMDRIGKKAPFFAFSFLGFPFHDFQLSHQNFDDEVYNFFNWLNHSELLRKTMVIFGADHGDRLEFFGTEHIEGFVERSLPFLFVHFPQSLLNHKPEYRAALKHNTKVLTTHFDVFHTMLHVLALTDQELISKFPTSVNKRSSLLRPITEPRGCSELKIEKGMCACDVGLSPHSVKDKHFVHRLYVFAVTQLNTIIRNSSYAELCGDWAILAKPEVEAHQIQERENSTNGSTLEYLLFFATVPLARFQVRIHVNVEADDGNKFVSLQLGGEFERKGSYGNSSSCLIPKTFSDRKFKELCYCKT